MIVSALMRSVLLCVVTGAIARAQTPAYLNTALPFDARVNDLVHERDHRWVVERGRVRLLIGASSADIRLDKTINLIAER